MRNELLNAGTGLLLCGAIMLIPVVLMIHSAGAAICPGLLAGGEIGLAFALARPGMPSRAGNIMMTAPNALRPEEQKLQEQVVRLRRPAPMVAAALPFFIGVVMYARFMPGPARPLSFGDYFPAVLCASLCVLGLAWGTQYLDALWALRRERRS